LLAVDDSRRVQYNVLKSYWADNDEQYADSDILFQQIKARIVIDAEEAPANGGDGSKKKRISYLFWRNVAAVLLAGICCYGFYYFRRNTATGQSAGSLQVIKIPSRTKSGIVLSDGTVITLNSQTVLRYPAEFKGPTREVYLNGEAFFDVAKDHKHPFIVHAGDMNVRVLGTAFNIKSYANDEQSETTLIRGSIEVTLSDRPSDRIFLKPHDKLILHSKTFKKTSAEKHMRISASDSVNSGYALTNLTYLRPNDTTIVETSWVNNKLVFKDETFDVLANQMERWYGIKVKFASNAVKAYRFTGIFEKESITEAFDALKMIEPFNYKYKNETVYIH
jgi:ferric-dicitrate binding protein FerR (iron transport regulator)